MGWDALTCHGKECRRGFRRVVAVLNSLFGSVKIEIDVRLGFEVDVAGAFDFVEAGGAADRIASSPSWDSQWLSG